MAIAGRYWGVRLTLLHQCLRVFYLDDSSASILVLFHLSSLMSSLFILFALSRYRTHFPPNNLTIERYRGLGPPKIAPVAESLVMLPIVSVQRAILGGA